MLYFSVGVCVNRKERSALEIFAPIVIFIRHPGNEKGTGAEMRPAIVSGIITRARAGQLLANYFSCP